MLLFSSVFLYIIVFVPLCYSFLRNYPLSTNAGYFQQLPLILSEILRRTEVEHCYAVITDSYHEAVLTKLLLEARNTLKSCYVIKLLDSEDTLSPNYQTVKILQNIKRNNCDLMFILLLNGIQVKRLLIFLEQHRIINNNGNFVLLYDRRILISEMHYIWRKLSSTIFIQPIETHKSIGFRLIAVPYPHILRHNFIYKIINEWKNGRFTKRNIFTVRTNNLEGMSLNVVVQEHIPMVMRGKDPMFSGVEVEILKSVAKCMNFRIEFYQSNDTKLERWGRHLLNGSYTGLVGEMVSRKADIALGDFHFTKFNLDLMDLTTPYCTECLTFLTPESTTDNSWKTLILPLNGDMWAGVVISLLLVGTLFYTTSHLRSFLIMRAVKLQYKKAEGILMSSNARKNKDIFDDFSNCILLTYSMLLLVSLPKMPKSWPLRVLTGWYWIYCILVAVIYRSSFTAILANPSPRITIDTLQQLAESRIIPGAWGEQNRKFFQESFDKYAREIGKRLEEVHDINGTVERIARGEFAYYDNAYFLRSLRLQWKNNLQGEEVLHIMQECVITMPISIGLEKNSPLKRDIDKYLQRLIEGGFIQKWLKDYTNNLPSEEALPQEALMDLHKFWSSFIVLLIGYFSAVSAFIGEVYYFKHFVLTHPMYDAYNQAPYYEFINRKDNQFRKPYLISKRNDLKYLK